MESWDGVEGRWMSMVEQHCFALLPGAGSGELFAPEFMQNLLLVWRLEQTSNPFDQTRDTLTYKSCFET